MAPLRTSPNRSHRLAVAAFGLGAALSAVGWMLVTETGRFESRPSASGALPAGIRGGASPSRSVAELQAQLRDDPDDWRGWAALGIAYIEEARVTGNPAIYPKASGAFERSLALRSDGNVAAVAGRAALANARHDFAGGLQFADKAAAMDRSDPQVNAVRGDSLIELGRYDEAFGAYQRLVDTVPGLAAYTRAAHALELQGDLDGAARSLQFALGEAFTPRDLAFARLSLGELAWNRGDLDGARQHYTSAARADPDAVGPKAGLARVHAATGAVDEAIARWLEVVERSPLPEHVGELLNLYQVTGQTTQARQQRDLLAAQRALLSANGVNGNLELALFSADHRLDLDGGLAAAESEWKRRTSIHAADALAWQLHAHGRNTEALVLANDALRLGTPNALFHFHRGMIQRALGDTESARADLRRALSLNPHFSTLHAPAATEALADLDRTASR